MRGRSVCSRRVRLSSMGREEGWQAVETCGDVGREAPVRSFLSQTLSQSKLMSRRHDVTSKASSSCRVELLSAVRSADQ
jgi:hypothetical protein